MTQNFTLPFPATSSHYDPWRSQSPIQHCSLRLRALPETWSLSTRLPLSSCPASSEFSLGSLNLRAWSWGRCPLWSCHSSSLTPLLQCHTPLRLVPTSYTTIIMVMLAVSLTNDSQQSCLDTSASSTLGFQLLDLPSNRLFFCFNLVISFQHHTQDLLISGSCITSWFSTIPHKPSSSRAGNDHSSVILIPHPSWYSHLLTPLFCHSSSATSYFHFLFRSA